VLAALLKLDLLKPRETPAVALVVVSRTRRTADRCAFGW